jgi:replicative DNA helicase
LGKLTLLHATIPYDDEAERQVVGSVVANRDAAHRSSGLLSPDEFYRPAFGLAFEAACQLGGVSAQERRLEIVAQATGLSARVLTELVNEWCPSIERWCCRVRQAARRRRLMALASQVYNEAATLSPGAVSALSAEMSREAELLSSLEPEAAATVALGASVSSMLALGAFLQGRPQ